jgi:hypothetical protein
VSEVLNRGWWLVGSVLLLVLLAAACGDDTAGGDTVDLTVVNESGEDVAVFIDGSESRLDEGDEDTITLVGSGEFSVLVTGAESGETLFSDDLSADEIEDLDNRIVVTSAPER